MVELNTENRVDQLIAYMENNGFEEVLADSISSELDYLKGLPAFIIGIAGSSGSAVVTSAVKQKQKGFLNSKPNVLKSRNVPPPTSKPLFPGKKAGTSSNARNANKSEDIIEEGIRYFKVAGQHIQSGWNSFASSVSRQELNVNEQRTAMAAPLSRIGGSIVNGLNKGTQEFYELVDKYNNMGAWLLFHAVPKYFKEHVTDTYESVTSWFHANRGNLISIRKGSKTNPVMEMKIITDGGFGVKTSKGFGSGTDRVNFEDPISYKYRMMSEATISNDTALHEYMNSFKINSFDSLGNDTYRITLHNYYIDKEYSVELYIADFNESMHGYTAVLEGTEKVDGKNDIAHPDTIHEHSQIELYGNIRVAISLNHHEEHKDIHLGHTFISKIPQSLLDNIPGSKTKNVLINTDPTKVKIDPEQLPGGEKDDVINQLDLKKYHVEIYSKKLAACELGMFFVGLSFVPQCKIAAIANTTRWWGDLVFKNDN